MKTITLPATGHLHTYRGVVRSVYDGDTVRVDLDLGFGHIWHGQNGRGVNVRLYGVDTPELRGGASPDEAKRAIAARDFVKAMIPIGSEVLIRTYKDDTDKYGRYLATIINAAGACVNSALLAEGHAREYFPE